MNVVCHCKEGFGSPILGAEFVYIEEFVALAALAEGGYLAGREFQRRWSLFIAVIVFAFVSKFLMVIFTLLFLISCFRPWWLNKKIKKAVAVAVANSDSEDEEGR